jgi:hypothetical protein
MIFNTNGGNGNGPGPKANAASHILRALGYAFAGGDNARPGPAGRRLIARPPAAARKSCCISKRR